MVSVKVNNIMNDFHMLSNLQFVENRVYDEEVQESVPDTKPVEKTKEQREAEMLPKIVKALELGMSVLDKAFNKINVNEISDSEDEDMSSEGRTILEPKNPYENRPLPFIIGSEEFMSDEYAGLKDLIQEDVESSVESESSSSDSDETSSSEDELPLDDGKFSGIPTPRKEAESISDRYSSSEESELFGVEKESNGFISDSSIDVKPREVQKPAEEPKTAVRDSRQSSVSSLQSKLNLPQVLPTPKHAQKKKESEGLFTNDDEFSDEDSPFRRKTGLFASEPRFDDDKDMFANDLFGTKTKEDTKSVENPKATPSQKLPSAVPKSKEPDLFGDDEDSDDDIFNKLTRAKKPTLPKESFISTLESPDKADSSSTPSSAPSVKPSGNAFDFGTGSGNADALFGDDSDGDDLFSSKKTITTKKFDFDDDDDDDLFGSGNKKKAIKTEAPEKKKPSENEKVPPVSEPVSKEKSYKKMGMPLPGLVAKKPKDSIFEDSDSSEQGDKKTNILPSTRPTKEKKEISLFDDDDDEDDIFSQKPKLFSPGKSPSVKNKPEDSPTVKTEKVVTKKETPPVKETAPSLFDGFEEDDKAMFPVPTKKADTSLFEESDSFDLFKPKAVEKQKKETIKPSPTTKDDTPVFSSEVTKKADTSLFTESDNFDLFKPKTVERQKVEPPKSAPTPVSKPSEASLFSSADESDGATSTKLAKSSSPVKTAQEAEDGVLGFDVPADSSKTLNVISKDRVKIASKRRKPTRKGRLAAIESSDTDKVSDEPTSSAPTKSSLGPSDDLFSNEEPETHPTPKPASIHKSQEKKKMDLMSQLMSEAASSKVLKKTPKKVEEEEEEVVDIFAELDGKRDAKSQSFSFKSPIESTVKSKSDFVDDDKPNEEEVSSVLVSDEAEDDFFSEPSFRKFSSSIPKKDPILDMDDDDEDDLFSIKPSSTLKPKTDASDVDIFADEADIFADLPKEKYEMFPSQLYDDEDDDDIFSSLGPSSNKVDKSAKATVPVKKETEKKVVKEVEKKPAFEDPLTGLLGGD
nr:WASH complex subunit 2 [Parasteatoda tepidariorum]